MKHKDTMMKYFEDHIKNHIPPKKEECLKFINLYPLLFDDKTWVQIKVFVYNKYRNSVKINS